MEIASDLNDTENINITTYDLNNDLQNKSKQKKFNNIDYKTQLLNIDSRFRDTIPKNIYKSNNEILPTNPIQVNRGSNIIKINYPNHNFNVGDSIIL